ncbi:TolC family protein [Breoghania sp.]|uniref:TolC family protein n=1 Tax=Breoghania sp. TaxID=2065378 RepID=UPI002AAB68C0|nr:TolC family protein [Breoghania sp.]
MTVGVIARMFGVATAVFLVSACAAIQPSGIDEQSLLDQARADRVSAREGVEPIEGKLSLDEAMARALKYNLDRRVKMMEEALAFKELDVSKADMLPRLVAQAGYDWRNNDKISQSRNSQTGALSTSRFISQEREHETASLALSWNILDLGVGYYSAKQQADRVLIASERRRKAMHLLMQDVRTAYWRAYSAQRLRARVRATTREAEAALTDARRAEQEKLRNPLDSLRYQRQVLENLRLLESIDQELSTAQIELASLINAPLNQKLVLIAPRATTNRKVLRIPVEVMEETALVANADLRQEHYNARIARVETRKVLLKLFPNLIFKYGGNHDTDVYLLNNNWLDASAQLSYNLFNLLTAPTRMKLAKAGVSLADQRRVAMQMAVMAQVHLARQNYANALRQFARADAIWETDRRIAEHMKNREAVEAQSKLDSVANQTTAILSLLRRYQALALAQAAEAKLQATLGVDPPIGSVDELSLAELSREIAASGGVRTEAASASRARIPERKAAKL